MPTKDEVHNIQVDLTNIIQDHQRTVHEQMIALQNRQSFLEQQNEAMLGYVRALQARASATPPIDPLLRNANISDHGDANVFVGSVENGNRTQEEDLLREFTHLGDI